MKKIMLSSGCLVMVLAGIIASAHPPKLVIWSHWGEQPVNVNFMNAAAERFQQQYGITAEIVWLPKPELMEKLVFALDTPEPDISYIDHGFTHPRIWNSLADLHDLTLPDQRESSWELVSLGGKKKNFLPIEGLSNAIYYNKDLFKQANIVLPQDRTITTEEFLHIIRSLKAAGITPIGEGTADRTIKVGIPLINTIFRYAGPEKVAQLYQGEINFSDPDVVEALKYWKQVVDAGGYDASKVLQLTLAEGIFEVTDGRAAISFCGTYFYSKYGSTERDKGQIGVLDWFPVEHGKGNAYYEILWAAGFGVNRHSEHLKEAKQFLAYLLTPKAAALWTQHLQSPYPVTPETRSPHSLYDDLMTQRIGQSPAPEPFTYNAFASTAAQQMWEDCTRRFIMGELTVEQFIERMNSRL